jgi:hypothetical protein
VKNHKLAKNSTTTKAREEIHTVLESLEKLKFFDVRLTKFRNNRILFNKISHRFLMTIELFIGWKILFSMEQCLLATYAGK